MNLHTTLHRLGLLSLILLTTASTVWAQDISVQLDGRRLQFDQPPAMIGGRLLVPLRGIFEALKADVVYDGATRSIQATKGARVVQLQLGSRTAIIDGRTLYLDVPADTVGGRTMVPLRFVSEALGADVKWEGATKTVRMSSIGGGDDSPTPPNGPTSPPTSGHGPQIDRVFHSATRPLTAGQAVDIVVYGEPNATASFEILGATKLIAIPEVSSGKYQTRWIVPKGLQVENGILLAHLTLNGRETASQSDVQVTVRGGNENTQSAWQEQPGNDTVIADHTPQVSLQFPSGIQRNSIRFFVDGVDFSSQVKLNGRDLTWTPGYSLSNGTHQVDVQAIDSQGQRLNHSWSFRIDPNAPDNTGQGFQVREFRPADNASIGPRGQIGVIFNAPLRSIDMYVDSRLISNLPGVQRLTNGILWNPNYDLDSGQHRATVKAVDQQGQVLQKDWNFMVATTAISNFQVAPTTVSAGQRINVSLSGPTGASGTFQIGQVTNIALRETSSGVYQGSYTVGTRDQGKHVVTAQLRMPNGQTIQATAPQNVTFSNAGQFTVTNLQDGMTVAPIFNAQGRGQAGRTVSILVEYSSSNILEVIVGQTRQIRTSGVINANGSFDIPVDVSALRSGQNFRMTLTDGQSPQVQLTMTRR